MRVSGPYPWAVALRQLVSGTAVSLAEAAEGKAAAPETTDWIVAHADALGMTGYGVGVVLLWFANLTWLSFLLIAAIVTAWQVFLNRMAPTTDDEAGGTPMPGPGPTAPAA